MLDPLEELKESKSIVEMVEKAIAIAGYYGNSDEPHHVKWALDQMVRALTGCPIVALTGKDVKNQSFDYLAFGKSAQYQKFLDDVEHDPAGWGCAWDPGIAP